MKDKRQRMAIAWPYAAVYSDPAFAASLLQAAASTLNYPSPTPAPTPAYTNMHSYSRFHPYSPYGVGMGSGMHHSMMHAMPAATQLSQLPQMQQMQQLPQLPMHPQTIPGLHMSFDFPYAAPTKYPEMSARVSPNSPISSSDSSLSPSPSDGLLMPVPLNVSPPPTFVPTVLPQTQIKGDKEPKLFKPYTSDV